MGAKFHSWMPIASSGAMQLQQLIPGVRRPDGTPAAIYGLQLLHTRDDRQEAEEEARQGRNTACAVEWDSCWNSPLR